MKTGKYRKRFYRNWVAAKGLYSAEVIVQETDVHVLTDRAPNTVFIRDRIRFYRQQIEDYIARDPRFLTALKPIAVELDARPIVKRMADAGRKANVGPMAAVAGALAEGIGRDLLKKGCREAIVENGGDIFLCSRSKRHIGIYAGPSKLWQGLRLLIRPHDTPLGICTSSGTIGHSLSFGCADSVVILAKNTALADAVATAAGNRVKTPFDLKGALSFACAIPGVRGAVIILGKTLASRGKLEFLC